MIRRQKKLINSNDIIASLKNVTLHDGKNVVEEGVIGDILIQKEGGGVSVFITLEVNPALGPSLEGVRQKCESVVQNMSGVGRVGVVLTSEKTDTDRSVSNIKTDIDPHGVNKNPPLKLPVKHIVAVASGKGGVGKSTVSSHLAMALAKSGLSTGLLDADIYGPSQPRMMGQEGKKPEQMGGRIIPLEAYGVKLMSIGFMVDSNAPLIWRGPMVQSAIYQMLRDVDWACDREEDEKSELDVLVVDMPPGTGDAQLTMAQKVPLSGAVIVSTPQDIALLDARKAVGMFRKTNVPILGIIENMSTHVCSSCGHEEHIFGHGGAENEASELGVPFLGNIPLSIDIRKAGDAGQPVWLEGGNAQAAYADSFKQIAKGVKNALKF